MLGGVQGCAYSHTAALCNYSFLVRYARSFKSPICSWKKYTLITPLGMTDAVCPSCMHAVSAICPWATVLVYNSCHACKRLCSRTRKLGGFRTQHVNARLMSTQFTSRLTQWFLYYVRGNAHAVLVPLQRMSRRSLMSKYHDTPVDAHLGRNRVPLVFGNIIIGHLHTRNQGLCPELSKVPIEQANGAIKACFTSAAFTRRAVS